MPARRLRTGVLAEQAETEFPFDLHADEVLPAVLVPREGVSDVGAQLAEARHLEKPAEISRERIIWVAAVGQHVAPAPGRRDQPCALGELRTERQRPGGIRLAFGVDEVGCFGDWRNLEAAPERSPILERGEQSPFGVLVARAWGEAPHRRLERSEAHV